MTALGIDIGGTGIKGALVNTSSGELLAERHRLFDAPASDAEGSRRHRGGDREPFRLAGATWMRVPCRDQGWRGLHRCQRLDEMDWIQRALGTAK